MVTPFARMSGSGCKMSSSASDRRIYCSSARRCPRPARASSRSSEATFFQPRTQPDPIPAFSSALTYNCAFTVRNRPPPSRTCVSRFFLRPLSPSCQVVLWRVLNESLLADLVGHACCRTAYSTYALPNSRRSRAESGTSVLCDRFAERLSTPSLCRTCTTVVSLLRAKIVPRITRSRQRSNAYAARR